MDVGERTTTMGELVQRVKNMGRWIGAYDQLLAEESQHKILQEILQHVETMESTIRQRSLEVLRRDPRPLVNRTDSAPHVAQLKHTPKKIQRVEYDFNDEIDVPYDSEYTKRKNGFINSETDVQSFILGILESIAKATSDQVKFAQNRRICGVECDILLLYGKNCIPFAAVEIKKNGDEKFVRAIFEDDGTVEEELKGKVQAENLMQLEQIQLFGLKKVFGVISDGNHSMITCTETFSKKEDLPNKSERPSRKRSATAMNGGSASPDNSINFVTTGSVVTRRGARHLYCSNYSDFHNSENWEPTLKLLTHFLQLSINTVDPRLFCRNVPLNTNLPARVITLAQTLDVFAHSTVRFVEEPNLWSCLLANKQVQQIFLCKHLGMGVNGDCCLATTSTRKSFCAVKFYAERAIAVQSAQKERDLWNTIYEKLPKSRVVELPPTDDTYTKDACLCMPYLVPIDAKDNARNKALNDGSIRSCLQLFAGKGFHHVEIRWRHLGLFRDGSSTTPNVYLCDLGNLRKREKESNSEWKTMTDDWIEESIAKLTETVSEEDV